MSALSFAIVIHNHQPVGNFDHVIEDAYARAYLPFLEVIERRPSIRIALHNSGCLWEWLEAHHPDYIDRVAALVGRGQVEILGGGFYEPILPLLPSENRRGQIGRMSDYIERRFGERPKGMWLAERVWEPDLPRDLVSQGIRWLSLDDTQFLQVGLLDEELKGRYLTEDGATAVSIYPTQMELRYEIPFAPPEKVIETLRGSADDRPGTIRVFGDDGEKFGVWPQTDRLCYGENQWLNRFFDQLERNGAWLRLVHLSEHMEEHPPVGRVYLPAGSYREMTEWALPPATQRLFHETQGFLRQQGRATAEGILLKGGFFRNFLARYPESNQIHKRVLDLLARLDQTPEASPARNGEVLHRLWRAQSNDAYWHGVFGGLYLPHLRDGLYRELILAENALERALHPSKRWAETRMADYDCDGVEEVILSSDRLGIHMSPRRGGGIVEIDDRASARNIVNGLSRRPEAYHDQIRARIGAPGSNEAHTIHDGISMKEANLDRLLTYDRRDRLALVERFFSRVPDPKDLIDGDESERGDFVGSPFRVEGAPRRRSGKPGRAGQSVDVVLVRSGILDRDPSRAIEVRKRVRLCGGDDGFEVELCLRSRSVETLSFHFGIEWLVNFLAGRAHDRYILVDGRRPDDPMLMGSERHPGARVLSLVDEWMQERVDLTATDVDGWVRAPLVTVSLSEAGAESIYQGTVVLPYWEVGLDPGAEWSTKMALRLRHGRTAEDEPGT